MLPLRIERHPEMKNVGQKAQKRKKQKREWEDQERRKGGRKPVRIADDGRKDLERKERKLW